MSVCTSSKDTATYSKDGLLLFILLFGCHDQCTAIPLHAASDAYTLLLSFIIEQLPAAAQRIVVRKASPPSYSYQPRITRYAGISDRPTVAYERGGDLDGLPDVRFGIDYAHVGLVCAAVDEKTIIELQEGMIRIILSSATFQ
jgi:hypothetical protein